MVYYNGSLHGMNSSGYSSKNISIDILQERGISEIPVNGVIPITVPGTPKGWATLLKEFGTITLEEALAPAVKLAEEGFIISETVGFYFERAMDLYKKRNVGNEYNHFFTVFTKDGVPYKAGDLFKSQWHADTLKEIGKTNSDSFYKGTISKKIVSFMEQHNGYIDAADLAEYEAEMVTPIKVHYKGLEVYEIPPNGQGITALMALNLVKNIDPVEGDVNTIHKQIEALKIAFSDTLTYVTDEKFMKINKEFLVSDQYVSLREKDITDNAVLHQAIDYKKAGTVYLATADKEGNMVSFIQSNYMGFGSGIVIDDTGIAMQNRGHTFSLDKNHHNALAPRKRTYHTIIPGFLMEGSKPIGPFGVMGGFMQPQGHMQVVMNMVDYKMNPQEALDAPRFRWDKGLIVALESTFDDYVIEALKEKGHDIKVELNHGGFGRGQIILTRENGYEVGTETRCDGHIAYY